MDDLIIRVLGGNASRFEEERLKRWREESLENERTFLDMARVWELTGPEPVTADSKPPEIQEILDRATALEAGGPAPEGMGRPEEASSGTELPLPGRRETGKSGSGRRSWLFPHWWLMAAAVGALSLGLSVSMARGPEAVAAYEAPRDHSLTVSLRDGSFVRLARGARLQEWAGEGERLVSLEGRAFFAVAHDEDRPFQVRTPVGRVQVLGTRFELRAQGDSLRTVVVEGIVAVSNEEGAVTVTAGEVAQARAGVAPSVSKPEDVYGLMDWPEGVLVFQGTPLKLVAEEVTHFFGRPLTVAEGVLENRRITAWFEDESFEDVSGALCQASGAVCRGDGSGVAMALPGREGRRP